MNVEYTVDECSASSKAHCALSKTISKTITFKFCTILYFVLLHLKSNFTFPSTLLCVQSNTSELFTLWISLLGTADFVFLWPYLPEMHQAYKIIIPKCNSGESQNLWPNIERSSRRWVIFVVVVVVVLWELLNFIRCTPIFFWHALLQKPKTVTPSTHSFYQSNNIKKYQN